MTKENLKQIIGENIRKERISRNISVEELAEMLGLTAGFLGLIERGLRGTTQMTMFKLAGIFDVPMDTLFYGKDSPNPGFGDRYKNLLSIKKLASLTSDFTEREMEFIIAMVKNLRILNRTQEVKN